MLRKINIVFLLLFSCFFTILAFPRFNQNYFIFFSLIPFFLLLFKSDSKKLVILTSLIWGILINLGFFYWIIPTFRMAGIPYPPIIFTYFLASFYFSLYWLAFGYIFYKLKNKFSDLQFSLILSAVFVILEYLRTYFLSGFPWNLVGYSQWNNLYFIQTVDIFGVYFVSFLIIWINIFFSTIFYRKYVPRKFCVILVLVLALNFGYGFWKLHEKTDVKTTIKVGILQGNIDQYKKFDEDYLLFIKNRYLSLVEESKKVNPDIFVLVWPETSLPIVYPYGLKSFFADTKLNFYQILGVFSSRDGRDHNSAVLVDKGLKEVSIYDKNHLVPFGEIIPFKNIVEKAFPILTSFGNLDRGYNYQPLDCGAVKFGTSICFESLFGDEVRKFVLNDANILVNISNDAWYLDTSAPYQHFSFNIFRAIENRRYVVRSANTGISAFIDDKGRVLEQTNIYEKNFISHDVPILKSKTIYTRFGDFFVYLCMLFLILRKKNEK